jgi:hypothetical protein
MTSRLLSTLNCKNQTTAVCIVIFIEVILEDIFQYFSLLLLDSICLI